MNMNDGLEEGQGPCSREATTICENEVAAAKAHGVMFNASHSGRSTTVQ
jgi:hypothetical protein